MVGLLPPRRVYPVLYFSVHPAAVYVESTKGRGIGLVFLSAKLSKYNQTKFSILSLTAK
jgi:hypothetical protein